MYEKEEIHNEIINKMIWKCISLELFSDENSDPA